MAYKFCTNCGHKLSILEGAALAPQTCANCGMSHYHNSRPCAGILVVHPQGHAVLLVRRGIEPFKGYWDIPGGFLEPGEHPEEGARREAFEETGLQVELSRLHGIYMDGYDDPDSRPTLNIYYVAQPIGGAERAASDAVELRWFGWDELPAQIAFAHAAQVLADWRAKEIELISV